MVNTLIKRMLIGVVIAIALVIVVGAIALVIMLRKPGSSKQRSEEQHKDGIEFGKTVDQQGCITEGLKRGKKLGAFDVSAQIENESFVLGCLQTSSPTAGFCDGVPTGLKNIVAGWDKKKCEKINVFAPVCEGILKQQIYFCDPKHNRGN